jgi:16S rRNA (adenine1518-N6/adenine1519-N6)-dimethyltransferase
MVRPKKHLGQHFLHDENIARKITGCLPGNVHRLVEVGPGTGVLTKYFLDDPRLDARFYEIDDESVEYLLKTFPSITGKLFHEDFLRADLSVIPAPFTVIGNFPYNISSQILFKVLDYRDRVPCLIGMFQKEVAERISSPPGSKRYGILSVLLKAYYDIEYLFTVSESCFYPQPKVKSAVIRLTRNESDKPDCDEEMFFALVKAAFNQRRKTLRNALGAFSFKSLLKSDEIFGKRAEQLSVDDFIFLAKNAGKSGPAG